MGANMTREEKIEWIKSAAFLIESLAHFQGKEEVLPIAEALREIARLFPEEG